MLDLLFEAVALFNRIVGETAAGQGGDEGANLVEDLIARLDRWRCARRRRRSRRRGAATSSTRGCWRCSPSTKSTACARTSERALALSASARRSSCDDRQGARRAQGAAKPHGEIITYLPPAEAPTISRSSSTSSSARRRSCDAVQRRCVGDRRGRGDVAAASRRGGAPADRGAATRRRPRCRRRANAASGPAPALARGRRGQAAAPTRRAQARARRGRADAAVGGADGARRHPQARSPDEHRRRARHRARRLQQLLDARRRSTARRPSSRATCTTSCARFDRHLGEMQAGILEVRMVPLGQVFDKLSRVVRQITREADKEVSLVITGAETEVDKLIVEELSDPLMHMMRNASTTASSARRAARAPASPRPAPSRSAPAEGNHVVIEIEDDGARHRRAEAGAQGRRARAHRRARGARDEPPRAAEPRVPARVSTKDVRPSSPGAASAWTS